MSHPILPEIRLGRIIAANDFPEARKPAYQLTIDLGPHGIKHSSAQLVGAHARGELPGTLVWCVCGLPPKNIAGFVSEVLVLGAKNTQGPGWVLATVTMPEHVELGAQME